jgi:hypothetical protein
MKNYSYYNILKLVRKHPIHLKPLVFIIFPLKQRPQDAHITM